MVLGEATYKHTLMQMKGEIIELTRSLCIYSYEIPWFALTGKLNSINGKVASAINPYVCFSRQAVGVILFLQS
ncbi:hypothetical protein SCARR_04127 [Pontiella sulfatireligans]|uniref:Uncharacterized protein n=1 Tax=Pontiella sulfatireligans TaxID=2750658 RepID=A0A6C2UT22_9BACT|nr:hypothetical protein SCARR_04127 [Pontiella sulfatireligans]